MRSRPNKVNKLVAKLNGAILPLPISCSENSQSSIVSSGEDESEIAGSGLSTVTLNGVSYELETWPTSCGETGDENSFVIKAGPVDGDGLASLNSKDFTEEENTGGQIEISIMDHYFLYEGPVEKQGKTIRWDGTFEKYAKSEPAKQIDEIEGSGNITC